MPGVATNSDEVLAAAGSRYTYSANTLALDEALERGLEQLALVGMSCQSSVPPVMWSRKIGKVSKPIMFNIGLLCSKTFDDAIFDELFEAKYGLAKARDRQDEHQGRLPDLDPTTATYHEINLKECHAWTREGCTHCPDFAAEHADISTGGIGKFNDWTLTIVRTELGREIISRMIADGSIIARPGDEDPGAIALDAQAGREEPVPVAGRGPRAACASASPRRRRPPPRADRSGGAPSATRRADARPGWCSATSAEGWSSSPWAGWCRSPNRPREAHRP